MKRLLVSVTLAATVAALAGACSGTTPGGSPATTTVAASSTPAAETSEPAPSAVRSLSLEYMGGTGEDTPVWELGPEGATPIDLPRLGAFYGFDAEGRRLLISTHEGMWSGENPTGGGPAQLAAGDLAILDLTNGEVEVLVGSGVVEALWAPDHEAIAYIAIQPDTYELRWREPDGSERVLARGVTPDWSISPAGDAVAFTRNSIYPIQGEPGLYVVTVADGVETKVSSLDRGVVGSVSDQPRWSPDGAWVAMWYADDRGAHGVVLAAADGSSESEFAIDPDDAGEWWASTNIQRFLWFPDGDRIVATPWAARELREGEEPAWPLVVWDIDPASGSLTNGRLVTEVAGLLEWDVPGESVWVLNRQYEPERVELG